ncbi:hypothetical protein BKA64DRAFT_663745 [Cadophora sp. MPI-SDFR-AT-0126]|nr:hypothetical protein BKA64DRAFT_663745 [Leotiomycetes sp. MPI-SDFR-AT-0126]
MALQAPAPRDERARFLYLLWDDKFLTEKPYQVFVPLPDGVPEERQSNLNFAQSEEVIVMDIRGHPIDDFSLDTSGFEVARCETKLEDFLCPDDIESIYLQEMKDLLRARMPDAEKIVIFDWRIRKSVETKPDERVNMDDKMTPLLPAQHVHIGS